MNSDEVDFAKLEDEVACEVEVERRRQHLHDAKAAQIYREKTAPFITYLQKRLVATCKIDTEPRKIGETYWYDIHIFSAQTGNVSTYNTVCTMGVTPKENEGVIWFVGEESFEDRIEFYKEVLFRLLRSGLLNRSPVGHQRKEA